MISFKPLEKSDFPLLHTWLNIDFVTKWYAKRKFAYDDVEKKYSRYVEGVVPVDSFIVEIDNTPIGYCHTFKIQDYPEYNRCVGLVGSTAAVDMFIGDKRYIHKGLGEHIIRQFLTEIVFTKPDIDQCIAGPEPDNRSAIRVYEKAGFTYVKTIINPNGEHEYLMYQKKSLKQR
ncbi:GNAT family N-acetyltransferase [Candidatus Roizmanbacteria bacterium]|nr:GNAT family N-acetyltransferase [Candidatus Roizmanbacteria bacterium]